MSVSPASSKTEPIEPPPTVSSSVSPHYGTMPLDKRPLPEDFEDAYDREKWSRLVIAFLILASTAVLNPLAVAILNDIAPRTPLPDSIFALVPEQRWARTAGDALVAVAALFVVGYSLLHRFRLIVLRRVFLLEALLYLLRIVVLASTQLPVAYSNATAECVPVAAQPTAALIWHRLVWKFFQLGTSPPNGQDLCGDMLFSGHTTVFTTAIMICTWYMPRSLRVVKWLTVPVCVFGMLCLIFSRIHYSVDVLLGYWMSIGLYTIYHGFCQVPHGERRRSAYKVLLISRLFVWMEEPVPAGWLPNRLSWPLPCLPSFDALLRRLSDPILLPNHAEDNELNSPLLSDVVVVRNKSR